MWSVSIKRTVITFFMIARRKARKVAGAFVTTAKHWRPGKLINRTIPLWTWQLIWGLKYRQKNNTENSRSSANLTPKHQDGYKQRRKSASKAAHSSATAASDKCSFIQKKDRAEW